MILSVSRKTDIPAYHFDWFLQRVKEGYVINRNPMFPEQLYKTPIHPSSCDCIVFWTKNAIPATHKLDALSEYQYYFQYTITGYGADIESNLPDKKLIRENFRELSDKIGPMKMIWRYDPILFTDKYTSEWHLQTFQKIASELKGKTEKCVISFLDAYNNCAEINKKLGVYYLGREELIAFSKQLAEIGKENGMIIASCAEKIDLQECGIEHNSCIDKTLIERIVGKPFSLSSDKGQREACGCVQSLDIGTYNTCKNGCVYCYATKESGKIEKVFAMKDNSSPILCDGISEGDHVKERKVKSSVRKRRAQENKWNSFMHAIDMFSDDFMREEQECDP